MFKAIGSFIYRTPWWALVLFGISSLLFLAIFVTPFPVINLTQKGVDSVQKQAIQREIDSHVGQSLLGVAEEVIKGIHDNSTDPSRRLEMERALKQILRARNELENARIGVRSVTGEAANEARAAAIALAENVYEAAVEARERVEEDQQELRDTLESSNIPKAEWPKSLDQKLARARQEEQRAKKMLDKVREKLDDEKTELSIKTGPNGAASKSMPQGAEGAPLSSAGPVAPEVPPSVSTGQVPSTDQTSPQVATPLPTELRQDIKVKVASAVYRATVGSLLILLFIPLFVVIIIAKVFIGRAKHAQDEAEAKKREAEHHNFNRQLTEAKLKVLQAQVEPHFLFNTLANVQALTEVDPVAANEMIGHLIQYLRSSLPRMRQTVSTVAQEVELVVAYLNILKMRMGQRLSFSIDVSEAAANLSFPPMMLPSLVENAIKHGLEPQRLGGSIAIVVRVVGAQLILSVADTGRGLMATKEAVGGVGLTNIRERLAALYGEAGKLTLEQQADKGVIASISIPLVQSTAPAGTTDRAADAQTEVASGTATQAASKKPWVWSAVSRTHRVWGRVLSSTFVVLMILLAVIFGISWAALVSGILPININDVAIDGLQGMALGSLLLLAGFCAVAFALLVVVGVIYGLGLLLTGLLIFIPAVIIVSMFPVLAPWVLFGLLVYWIVRRRKSHQAAAASKTGE